MIMIWSFLFLSVLVLPSSGMAEAAVSKGKDKQLETAATTQGGGTATSSQYRQQTSIGEGVASNRISSSTFRIIPGFLGASLSSPTAVPKSDLDLKVLYALTGPLGQRIPAQTWQQDRDPIFIWDPPASVADVAGYSYAVDAVPDTVIETTGTSFDVLTVPPRSLADGKHTFSVCAVNTAGNAGTPITLELWVDTSPPQIVTYTPAPGALLNRPAPPVSATISDPASGVNGATLNLLINGTAATVQFDPATGALTTTGGGWNEGANSLELRASDLAGNAQMPLVWSLTIDTLPPTGTLTINAGAQMTTSLYVTLELAATDVSSSVSRVLLSNEELAGYVEEPYVAIRELWQLHALRGTQRVFVKFVDRAGNISAPVSDAIDLLLLAPETVITSGPAGFTPNRSTTFSFACPESTCLFAYAFDNEPWSVWSPAGSATKAELTFGNHYFRVKAAKEANGTPGIQPDEEDASPAERTWIVGVEPPLLPIPRGPPIKVWRVE